MATNTGTGWERDRRGHFDEIVLNYDKARSAYPAGLFADVIAYAGPGKEKKALEIGAGTGKATAPFLAAGYDVTAVELGANMAAFLKEKFKENQSFSVINAGFEEASLREAHYDLIYAASAFHWVDAEIGCPKAYRLLKSGGGFALFRFNFNPPDGDALHEAIQAVYEEHYKSYYTSSKRHGRNSRDYFYMPSTIKRNFGFGDMRQYGFTDVTMRLYGKARVFSADEYIAFNETLADHRALPQSNRTALYTGIREAVARHGGSYKIEQVFQLYMGRKP